jgi:hypothetical protein
VGGHEGAVGRRLLDRRGQLLGRQLGGAGPGPEGEHGPGGDHLDEVGPAVQDRPHPLPDLGRGGCLPEPEVPRQLDVGGQAGDGPAAPRDGHVRAGHGHARPEHGAVADGVAQGHVDERPEGADVAHGREAGQHGGPGVGDPAERLLGGAAVDRRDAGPLELADQVGVAVDQAGQQRVAGKLDQGRALGHRLAGVEHGLDPLAADQHHPAGPHLPGLDVDHPVGPQRDQLAIPRHPASSCPPGLTMMTHPDFPLDRTIRRIRRPSQSRTIRQQPMPTGPPRHLAEHRLPLRLMLVAFGLTFAVLAAMVASAALVPETPPAPTVVGALPTETTGPTATTVPAPSVAPSSTRPDRPSTTGAPSEAPEPPSAAAPVSLAGRATSTAAPRSAAPVTDPPPSSSNPPASTAPTTTEPQPAPLSTIETTTTTVEPTTTTLEPTTTTVEETTTTAALLSTTTTVEPTTTRVPMCLPGVDVCLS